MDFCPCCRRSLPKDKTKTHQLSTGRINVHDPNGRGYHMGVDACQECVAAVDRMRWRADEGMITSAELEVFMTMLYKRVQRGILVGLFVGDPGTRADIAQLGLLDG